MTSIPEMNGSGMESAPIEFSDETIHALYSFI
jgi:hypothetical protein